MNVGQQTEINGTSETRCYGGELRHPKNGAAEIVFFWERHMTIEGLSEPVRQDLGQTTMTVDNPDALIAVVDPVTLLPTGETVSAGRVYQFVVSVAVQTARHGW